MTDPGHGTWPDQQQLLGLLARGIGAKSIVEAGTYRGETALVLSLMNPDAHVWTADPVDHGQEYLNERDNITYVRADFLEMLEFVPVVDFAYIDASGVDNTDTMLRYEHALAVWEKLSRGGMIVFDDMASDCHGQELIIEEFE